MDKRVKHKEIPLTGKFMTADPAATGENFQTLTNLRPTDTHIKGVQGMTKINTTQLGSALDFTDATEVDIVADRISVAASKITVTSIYSDEEAYVYFDYGADYFSGDFRIDFQFNCTEQTVSVFGYAFIFGLSNAIDDLEGNRLAEGAEIVVLNTGELLSLSEQNGAVATKDSITALDLATEYYATIIRNESAGTYGTVSLHVYSDSTRETEIASSPATIELTEKQDFRYLYTFSSWNSGLADVAWSGTVEDYFIVYSKTKNAFHFSKAQPQESHVLAQVAGADGKTVLIQNETPIPDVGNFAATEVWRDGKNNPGEIPGLGRFSNAPDGQMMYCNGVDSLIWGGDEILPSAFITSTAVVADGGLITDPKDFTDNIRSTSKTAENILLLGGGVDDYTVLMLHCEGDDGGTVFTDSSDSAHTVTAVGDANTDLSQAKFGVSSGVFDGTGDYLTIP
ncbi:MAG: hypothetical protein PF495_08480, partial [Spirochaetales bacterium]|nr:hypothetical protein [Spirochaetales bacterium]